MTYNTISYMIYAPITIYITIVVGWQCHKHGLVYILSIFKDEKLSFSINNLLLVGYYLTNIGYAVTVISSWEYIETINQLINELSTKIGTIVLLLAAMHYTNVAVLSFWRKSTTSKINY